MGTKSWVDDPRTPELVEEYKEKSVYIEDKAGWFWITIAWFLRIVTFGVYKNEVFLKEFATTIGTKVGVPREWTYTQLKYVMPHEARHVWQGKMCGFGLSAWVGLPIFFLLYVVLPIPVGFAWFRYLFEKDATRMTIRKMAKNGYPLHECLMSAEHSAETVASGAYIWAVPRNFAVKGYSKMVTQVWMESLRDKHMISS